MDSRTSPVDLDASVRLDVDLSQVTWRTSYVHPGTPYPDEETEMIPVGWYVMGEPSWDEETPFVLHLDFAYDEDGFDVTAATAQYIAATLTLAARAECERRLSRRARLRRAFKDVATFIGEAVGR
jgi:hypothetical protein